MLYTAEPSCRVSDKSDADFNVSKLIILARGDIALNPLSNQRPVLASPWTTHRHATACACFTHSSPRDRIATQTEEEHVNATLLVDACSICSAPVVHSAPHRSIPGTLGREMAGHERA